MQTQLATHLPLDCFVGEAIQALTVLDAAAIENLVAWIVAGGRIDLPQTAAERERAAAGRRVFEYLLGATARQLAMLRQFAVPASALRGYGPGGRGLAAGSVSSSQNSSSN